MHSHVFLSIKLLKGCLSPGVHDISSKTERSFRITQGFVKVIFYLSSTELKVMKPGPPIISHCRGVAHRYACSPAGGAEGAGRCEFMLHSAMKMDVSPTTDALFWNTGAVSVT